jgi:hypothetical protein
MKAEGLTRSVFDSWVYMEWGIMRCHYSGLLFDVKSNDVISLSGFVDGDYEQDLNGRRFVTGWLHCRIV